MQKALTKTGKMPPAISLSGVFLISFPAAKVSAAAMSEARLPNPTSHSVPVNRLAIRHPTYSAGIDST